MTYSSPPLISIIMTTYNRAGYIGETIKNIQGQSYTYWELLIEDDGSDDDTAAIIERIADTRIHYTRHMRTAVTGKLKNRALQKAKGELIAFMDSDDLWTTDKLERQTTALSANADAGWSFTNWADFYDVLHPLQPYYPETSGVETTHAFKNLCTAKRPVSTATVMFKTSCLDKVKGFNENRLFTDFSFIAQLAYHYKAVIFYEPMLNRRLHDSNNIGMNWAADFEEYQETVRQFINEGWIDYHTVRQTLFLSYINLGEKFIGTGDKSEAIKNYLKAWKYMPFSIIPAKKLVKTLFL